MSKETQKWTQTVHCQRRCDNVTDVTVSDSDELVLRLLSSEEKNK